MSPDDGKRSEHALRGLLLAALLHGLAYLAVMAPWMGEDEPWHFEHVLHVAEGRGAYGGLDEVRPEDQLWASMTHLQVMRRFRDVDLHVARTTQRTILESMRRNAFWRRVDWAGRDDSVQSFDRVEYAFTTAHQPPLYYLVAALPVWVFADAALEVRLVAARCLSLLAYLVTVWLAWRIGLAAFEDDPGRAFLVAFLVAWFPMHARMAGVVNNDVLARVMTSAVLLLSLLITRRGTSVKRIVVLGVLVALGLLTKTTAVSAVAVAALALLLAPGGHGKLRRNLLIAAVLGGILGLGVLFWLDSHNPAIPHSVKNLKMRLEYGLSLRALVDLRDTFLGTFNWETRLQPGWMRIAFGVFLVTAFAGALVNVVRARDALRRSIVLLAGSALAVQVALNLLRGVGKGRYLMPAICALAVLVVAALEPLGERARHRAGLALCAALVLYDLHFLWLGVVRNQYLVWGS